MKDFFSAWQDFLKRLARCRLVILLFDYDGTLTPIVKRPELAKLTSSYKGTLQRLAKKRGFRLAIISGRSLSDIKKIVGIRTIIFAGNHGMELSGPKISFVHKKARALNRSIQDIYKKLSRICKSFPGSFLENKGLTLAVHCRLIKSKQAIVKLTKAVSRLADSKEYKQKVRLTSGKKVFEIRPKVQWNKGKVVGMLIKRMSLRLKRILPIYIGDDRTDEDAFRVLRKKGITIFVGKPKKDSYAEYYLKNTPQVYKFLNRLLKIKIGEESV